MFLKKISVKADISLLKPEISRPNLKTSNWIKLLSHVTTKGHRRVPGSVPFTIDSGTSALFPFDTINAPGRTENDELSKNGTLTRSWTSWTAPS